MIVMLAGIMNVWASFVPPVVERAVYRQQGTDPCGVGLQWLPEASSIEEATSLIGVDSCSRSK